MHRKSLPALDTTKLLLLLVFVFSGTRFPAENPYAAGADVEKGCDELICKLGEQCVSRTFWCSKLPCPSMSYCSKSRKESLRGPESCGSVQCPSGYKCTVRVRDCRWNENCKDRAARCISEREFQKTPTSCTDVVCPKGHRCVLRETHCHRPPCKLTKSCARMGDMDAWFEKCKRLGCQSEHDCFLRRPPEKCAIAPCSHVPDCLSTIDFSDEEQCRGWICPANLECRVESSCDNCPLVRSCYEPLTRRVNSSQPIDILSARTTLADLEREVFLEERRKLLTLLKPTSASNFTKLTGPDENFRDIEATQVSMSYKNRDYSTGKSKRVTAMPNMRSTSSGYSPWLTYLKRKAGAEAVQYWIEKAKNNEEYEEFSEWLESVAGLLEPETYRLWLRELEQLPEFQSWISPRNLPAHRPPVSQPRLPTADDEDGQDDEDYQRRRSEQDDIGDARGTFPGSIGRQAKNLFYADNSFVSRLAEPDSNSDRHRQTFAEKQAVSPIIAAHPHVPESQRQQQHREASNFNFNEARRFDATAPAPFPYLEVARPAELLGRRQQQQLALSRGAQERKFSDTVKNSWKSWQSYYQLNPPPPNLPGFPAQTATVGPYYFSNYTSRGNFSIDSGPTSTMQQQPPQIFFPSGQIGFGKAIADSDENRSPELRRSSDSTLRRVKLDGNFPRASNTLSERDKLPVGLDSMIDQIAGLQRLGQSKPNVIKLDPSQPVSQLLLSSGSDEDENPPNLLIYFPPPLNFFIYYSTNNHNQNASANTLAESDLPTKNNKRIIPFDSSSLNSTGMRESSGNQSGSDGDVKSGLEPANKTAKHDKHKELEYIRKIIKELLDYWDEQEKTLESTIAGEKNENDSVPTHEAKLANEADAKPTFSTFLEWLSKNTTLLDQRPRKKKPPSFDEPDEHPKTNEGPAHQKLSSNDPTSGDSKIRILVDIDKNPEMMKALFSRNRTDYKNESDSHEYQVIVNLNDFVDPKEEELITRRLLNIASSQFHRNLTNDQKMPKILWVFPVYEDEDNHTVIDQINKINKVTTLEDVEAPITRTGEKNEPQVVTKTSNDPQIVTKPKEKNETQPSSQTSDYDAVEDDYDNGTNDDYDEKGLYDEAED
ncbi:uncharacterized protein LOC103317943 isoform X2 [Nasonia vitripennis]|uniref:Follistatin-like domain-containing protein n=1 Tax=Nasonia vitripennis TaxID=7425 RepID=A0A7M7ISF1_NASVI|nr:uncharacterized protein LOC103317943 isoform X2 [Nasonia vitripennis]